MMLKIHLKSLRGLVALILALSCLAVRGSESRPFAVEVTARIQRNPAQIQLNWRTSSDGAGYTVARKGKEAKTWTQLATLSPGVTTFTDTNVRIGEGYEYRVLKNPKPSYGGSGFIYAGIDLPLVENRGKLVLIVDSTYASQLQTGLARLQQDLIGDGWSVIRHDVARNATPPQVKTLIKNTYLSDPQNVKAVLLFGHVPVAYSGNIVPDGHTDHEGAWPADAYYGDMDGTWTDSTVRTTSATRAQNRNIPGDGKFDQSTIPSDVELQVGRVDLANLPGFAPKTELDLLRQYLNKDNNFRHGRLNVPRRGLINDNFGSMYGEAFAATGWRNFAPFFGSENLTSIPGWTYFNHLKNNAYLWSYACGGGAYNYCYYVGGTGDYNVNDVKTVFTFLLGSYFGDWDADNAFLRGPLGSPTYGLTAAWAGRPHWFVHHMALGETIGYGTKVTMNSTPYHPSQYARSVHIGLMGDPTLRLHPVLPPTNAKAVRGASGVQVTWQASTDTGLVGYHVYKAPASTGPFTRVNSNAISGTSYTDTTSPGAVYMVRAVKLESTPSGTYFNASQGIFANTESASGTGGSQLTILRSGTQLTLQFPTVAGKTYVVEKSSNYSSWVSVTNVTATGAITKVVQSNSGAFAVFRVKQL